MSLSRKERDQLAEVIQRENEMVLKVGRMVRNAFILTLAFAAVTYWGWSGMTDPMFPNIPMSVRNVAKWIALIGLILSGLFTVLGFISHRNGKKRKHDGAEGENGNGRWNAGTSIRNRIQKFQHYGQHLLHHI